MDETTEQKFLRIGLLLRFQEHRYHQDYLQEEQERYVEALNEDDEAFKKDCAKKGLNPDETLAKVLDWEHRIMNGQERYPEEFFGLPK